MAPVLIAGAGPTGLALALLLARQGISVQLHEASPAPWDLFRGEALMPSALAALAAMGLLPLSPSVPTRPLRGWSFWLEGQAWFQVEEPMGAPWACTLVDPGAWLRALAAELERHPAASLQLGSGLVGLLECRGHPVGARLSSGEERQADLVVACDGRGSALRRAAGLTLAHRERPIDVLWFHLDGPAVPELQALLAGRFHTLLGEGGSLALFPSARGGVQLGWPLRPGERPAGDAAAWRQRWRCLCPGPLAQALDGLPPAQIHGPLRLPVRVGLAQRWWRPGLLLLGDAAHPLSPVRAQGTAMGLRDALAAAAILAPALGHEGAEPRRQALRQALEEIEERRRPEIVRIQRWQQQEWNRGERLLSNPALRRLLSRTAPWSAPLIAAIWQRSQRGLRCPGGSAPGL